MKRGTSGLCGVLAIDKPKGITSHDVVNAVRRVTGERRVGHAGTLDPMAQGLMLVCVGAATRLSAYLTGHDKRYTARIVFGAATDTDDAEGRITTAYTKTAPGEGLAGLAAVEPQQLLDGITGPTMQLPPAFSAIKKNGVTAYKAAREGRELELEPRQVTIYEARFLQAGFEEVDLDDGQGGRFAATLPYWDVDLKVSKGTYIRSIARDLGQSLGCGAHLSALNRTEVGGTGLERAVSLEELGEAAAAGREFPWEDPVALLGVASACELSESELKDVSNGRPLKRALPQGLSACVSKGHLMALYEQGDGPARPELVIPGGVCGVRSARKLSALRLWSPCEPVCEPLGPRVLVIGVFDGLHNGHRSLLDAAVADAQGRGVPVSVLTFEKDPDEFFGREASSFKLMSDDKRLQLLRSYNPGVIAEVVAMRAERACFAVEPQAFLESLGKLFQVQSVHVGCDFRFGSRAAGTVSDIDGWCAAHGARCCPQELLCAEGEVVSATRIRQLLAEGDVDAAVRLGGSCCLSGVVVHGRGEGSGMGFATANVEPAGDVMLPREGVYGGFCRVAGACYAAAVNVGVARSFDAATAPVEAHLLDYRGDLYGKTVELELVHWMRPQLKFESQEELVATVMGNIQWVRDNLAPLAASRREGS
ncbi:MAG: tRNA pseudouridine(55) synthase TruB [Coriobacteriales bacterium]